MALNQPKPWMTLCILLCVHDFVSSTLVVVPSDTEATNGSNTQLNCSTNLPNPVHWQHIPLGSMLPTDVYLHNTIVNGYVGRFHVEVDISKGAYNLVINDTQFEDAGIFRCQDNRAEGEHSDAKLIVIGTPECSSSVNASHELKCMENVTLTCGMNFSGKARPTIVWKHEGRTIEGATPSFSSNNSVESYLTIQIEQGSSYSSNYSCLSIASNSACTITIQHNCTVSDESTVTAIADPVKSDDKIIRIVVPIVVVIVLIPTGIIIAFFIKRRCNGKAQESATTEGNVDSHPMNDTSQSEGQNQGPDRNQNEGRELELLMKDTNSGPASVNH